MNFQLPPTVAEAWRVLCPTPPPSTLRLGHFIRRLAASQFGAESVYGHLAIASVEAAIAEYGSEL